MTQTPPPILHRDDPDKTPLMGHTKVTRNDWINVARDILVSDGVAEVKVLAIGERLEVSRSSFYWYFKSRTDLLDALLDDWEVRNTATIIEHCALPAANITDALCNFFKCFIDPDLFDQGLDFAIREWSRRSGSVRQRIDAADAARVEAATHMYLRHGYAADQADAKARILYFMQLGYHALEVREAMSIRMARLGPYIEGFTGEPPDAHAMDAFKSYCIALAKDRTR